MTYTKTEMVEFVAGTFNNMFAYGNETISRKDAVDYLKYLNDFTEDDFKIIIKGELEYGKKTVKLAVEKNALYPDNKNEF